MPSLPPSFYKPDRNEIADFIGELEQKEWVKRTERSWWPRYIFHFTDINNAYRIFREGQLCCRYDLGDTIPLDSASPEIIQETSDEIKSFVRFYFRPQTPTQYRAEGIRPINHIWKQSHCPLPIFLLFDSVEILTRKGTEFSDGNLAGKTVIAVRGKTAEFLRELPFKKIYHVGHHTPGDRRIISAKQAEVIVPHKVDLSALRLLYCRSPAEKDTLLSVLSKQVKEKYQRNIRIAARENLFFKRWVFVQEAMLTSQKVIIQFSPDAEAGGPFRAHFRLKNVITGAVDARILENFDITNYRANNYFVEIPIRDNLAHYRFRLELDGNLAYQNEYRESDEVPF